MIRRRFVAEMKKRFKKVSRAIQKLVVNDDAFGLVRSPLTFMQETQLWRFKTSANKLTAYRDWLQKQVNAEILTVNAVSGKPWTATYVESAHRKGMMRAYTDAHKVELAEKVDFYEGTREQFLREAFAAPEMMSKVELLNTRVFEELRGVTNAMSQQMSRTLADGLAAGSGPATIARELRKVVANISKRRALVIARTETIHAHAEGQLDAFERLGVKELRLMAEWSTAGDDRVCEQCASLEGQTMTVEEARGQIPLHPNCRCAWIPFVKERRKAA